MAALPAGASDPAGEGPADDDLDAETTALRVPAPPAGPGGGRAEALADDGPFGDDRGRRAASDPHVSPGDLISGKYRLLRMLGAGGMGSVWAARNELTDRDFAIKFLLPALAQNKEALTRFFHEARACGQIKHPAVVDVYDMGQAEDGSPFIVMELLEGEGFDQRLARSGPVRPAEAAAWIAFVARGLEEAHVRGLVHRDLKPGNIFFALDDRGEVIPKILDFGVSKGASSRDGDFVKTSTGAVLGSPAYMSPEQAQGETDIDGRSDVWSLGVILYEALTGQVPFDAPNYNALMVAIMTRPHRPVLELAPHVPPELSAIVDHALAKDRSQRIGTARELADRLEGVLRKITGSPVYPLRPRVTSLAGAPASIRPTSTTQGPWSEGQRAAMAKRSSRRAWLGAVAVAGLVGLTAAVAVVQHREPMVAVAGRQVVAFEMALARLRTRLEEVRAEIEAAEAEKARARAEKEVLVVEPSELPPAPGSQGASSFGPAAGPKPGFVTKPRKPAKKNDPHGGVESVGF